jgi:alpha-1,2-glucosyltransferase
MSVMLKKIFMFKCTLPMLRLTTMLSLLALPVVLTRLLCHYQRRTPPQSWLSPTPDAIVVSAFPIAWFFGFLYYTEVPSLLFVALTMVAASQGHHWVAALVSYDTVSLIGSSRRKRQTGGISCTFRQTNVVWVLYAYASSQLVYLRFRRARPEDIPLARLHDPPALEAARGTRVSYNGGSGREAQ